MQSIVRCVVLIFAVGVVLPAFADDWKAEIDAVFEQWDATDSPGMMVHITRKGEVEYSRGFGMANIERGIPLSETSEFNIASMSKQFTAAAIAMLVEEGKLGLDDDIRTHLPYLPDYGHTVTIQHMVHHTSGLVDVLGKVDGRQFENGWGNQEAIVHIKKLDELKFAPGEQYEYSNTNYLLMAEIVEAISGQTLRAFLDERIFQPLGMTQTRVDDNLDNLEGDNVALSYSKGKRRPAKKLIRNDYLIGDGNVVTTVQDFEKWHRNFTTREVGSDVFHDMMLSTRPLNNGDENTYAFGLRVTEHLGRKALIHSGSWIGFRTIGIYYPDEEVSLQILANNNHYKYAQDEVATAYFKGIGE